MTRVHDSHVAPHSFLLLGIINSTTGYEYITGVQRQHEASRSGRWPVVLKSSRGSKDCACYLTLMDYMACNILVKDMVIAPDQWQQISGTGQTCTAEVVESIFTTVNIFCTGHKRLHFTGAAFRMSSMDC